jgi:rRNA maturation RNase YbeY
MEEPPSYHTILVVNRSSLSFDPYQVETALKSCLDEAKAGPANVRVLVTSDEHVQELNRRYRGLDEATDVLTFEDEDEASGDIAIAGPYAQRQAAARTIEFHDEVMLLAIHGTLHLLGLEDETEPGRIEMIDRMYDVAERFGVRREEDWGSLLHEQAAV